jgi:hypothetical protein
MLTYAAETLADLWLTYADECCGTLTHADVCWRMQRKEVLTTLAQLLLGVVSAARDIKWAQACIRP